MNQNKGTVWASLAFLALIVTIIFIAAAEMAPDGSNAQKLGEAFVQSVFSTGMYSKMPAVDPAVNPEGLNANFVRAQLVAQAMEAQLSVVTCVNGRVYDKQGYINPMYLPMNNEGSYCFAWFDMAIPSNLYASDRSPSWQLIASRTENDAIYYYISKDDGYANVKIVGGFVREIDEYEFNALKKLGLQVLQ